MGMIFTGCSVFRSKRAPTDANSRPDPYGTPRNKIIMSPETVIVGTVVTVRDSGRFVIVNFPVGSLPAIDQRLNVYRHGLRVGEVKVTAPQQDDNTAADIVSGDVHIGDEIRGN